MRAALLAMGMLASACVEERAPEDWSSWYGEAVPYDVEESIAWTDQPYSGLGTGVESGTIGELRETVYPVDYRTVAFGPGEGYDSSTCNSEEDDNLPWTVTGVVTLHPNYYFKTDGCLPDGDLGTSDEKYYASYFIQDEGGGILVLGDSRVAHFDLGNKVTMEIRGARTSYDLDMVYAHDILAVDREVLPLYYQVATTELTEEHVGEVWRIEGTLLSYDEWSETCGIEPGNAEEFGEYLLLGETAEGEAVCHNFSFGLELGRRPFEVEPGTRIQVTGPVTNYFGFKVLVEKIGQVAIFEDSGDGA